MRNVLVTINGGQGSDLGPNFSLTCDGGGVVTPNTATLSQLLAGKSVVVDDNATEIYVTATDGSCVGSPPLVLPISGIPTASPTVSPTASPTAGPTASPTASASPIAVFMSNIATEITVVSILVNAVDITSSFFPALPYEPYEDPGEGAWTGEFGTYTVTLDISGINASTKKISILDSNGASHCAEIAPSASPSGFNIPNITFGGSGDVTITIQDGTCA